MVSERKGNKNVGENQADTIRQMGMGSDAGTEEDS